MKILGLANLQIPPLGKKPDWDRIIRNRFASIEKEICSRITLIDRSI
jgi:hypothetical protein